MFKSYVIALFLLAALLSISGIQIPAPPVSCSVAHAEPPPIVAPKPFKLTIVNVFKADALVCTINGEGQLTFNCAVPAGEAVDVESMPGQRWGAVVGTFGQALNFKARSKPTNWVLRPVPTSSPPTLSPNR